MKTLLAIIAAILPLSVIKVTGAELTASKYMIGIVSRDVEGAFAKARTAKKPVVIVMYDAGLKPQVSAEYDFREFFSVMETRRLLNANFVQVMAPWTAKGIAQFREMDEKTGHASAVFLDKDGKFFARIYFTRNGGDSLKQVQEIVAKLQ